MVEPLGGEMARIIYAGGPGKRQVANFDVMLKEYYEMRKWRANWNPTEAALGELGLADVAAEPIRIRKL